MPTILISYSKKAVNYPFRKIPQTALSNVILLGYTSLIVVIMHRWGSFTGCTKNYTNLVIVIPGIKDDLMP